MSRLPPPIADYLTDTKSVLDNCARLLQAIIDMAAHGGWLDAALGAINLNQSIVQVCVCVCVCVFVGSHTSNGSKRGKRPSRWDPSQRFEVCPETTRNHI